MSIKNKNNEIVRTKLAEKISTIIQNHLNGTYMENFIKRHMIELAKVHNLIVEGLNTTNINDPKHEPKILNTIFHTSKTVSEIKQFAQEFADDVIQEAIQDLTKENKLKKKIDIEDLKRKLATDIEEVLLNNLNEASLTDITKKTLNSVMQEKKLIKGPLKDTSGRWFRKIIGKVVGKIVKTVIHKVTKVVTRKTIDKIVDKKEKHIKSISSKQ